jgi:hypothetical protein
MNVSGKISLTPRFRSLVVFVIAALERKVVPESAKAQAKQILLTMADAADSYLESVRPRRRYKARSQKGGGK